MAGQFPQKEHFIERLAAAWPAETWRDVTVVLAVSGGADSVSLLRGMCQLKTRGTGRLIAAHFNHGLRGAESDADERFVAELCQALAIPCEIGRATADLRAAAGGEGLESAARAARYEFFKQTVTQVGARFVVTAHTADDQAETILQRILRGTGLSGLAGISRVRPLMADVSLIRPMLDMRRAEVIAYLAALDQPFREDSTNLDRKLTRNRIRHELLPKIAADYSPAAVDSLLRLGQLAGEAQAVIDGLVQTLSGRSVSHPGVGTIVVACRALAAEQPYLVRELFIAEWRRAGWPEQAMGFEQWNFLAELAMRPAGAPSKRSMPDNISVTRQGDQLVMVSGK